MALTPGTRIGSYEVTALLGVGGMGHVFRARDTRLERDVAIKVLPDALAHGPERLARFEREYFTALYAECNGNVSEIGRRAAMERAHVRGYLRRHGIGDPKKTID